MSALFAALSTVEGIIDQAIDGLKQDQVLRRVGTHCSFYHFKYHLITYMLIRYYYGIDYWTVIHFETILKSFNFVGMKFCGLTTLDMFVDT